METFLLNLLSTGRWGAGAGLAACWGGETFLMNVFPAPKCILPASCTSYLLPIISWVLKVRRSSC